MPLEIDNVEDLPFSTSMKGAINGLKQKDSNTQGYSPAPKQNMPQSTVSEGQMDLD